MIKLDKARTIRKYNLRAKYRLDISVYDDMVKRRGGKCDICGCQPPTLFVDHDHSTCELRGLLCRECNTLLGFARDRVSVLETAVTYLETHRD